MLLLYASFLSLPIAAFCEGPLAPCDRVTSENGFRETFATSSVDPVYPEESIRAGHVGIAVARFCIGAGSTKITSIEIATAPDAAIAKALTEAVGKWRFIPLVDHQGGREVPISRAAKITYYFVKQQGQWAVLSPTKPFYVGPRFALPQQNTGRNADIHKSKGE